MVVDSVLAGASGYLLKSADPERLVEAVDTVGRGGSLLDPEIVGSVVHWMREHEAPAEDPLDALNEQERRIVLLIAEGKTNRQIAADLYLSEHTVKTYVSQILKKLSLSRRSEAAAFVARHGYLAPLKAGWAGVSAGQAPSGMTGICPTRPHARSRIRSRCGLAQHRANVSLASFSTLRSGLSRYRGQNLEARYPALRVWYARRGLKPPGLQVRDLAGWFQRVSLHTTVCTIVMKHLHCVRLLPLLHTALLHGLLHDVLQRRKRPLPPQPSRIA